LQALRNDHVDEGDQWSPAGNRTLETDHSLITVRRRPQRATGATIILSLVSCL